MPRLVHLPLALEGANKVHLISKIHHIIYETLPISQGSSYSQGWFISDVGNLIRKETDTLKSYMGATHSISFVSSTRISSRSLTEWIP